MVLRRGPVPNNRDGGIYNVAQMPSHGKGRAKIEYSADLIAASGTLLTAGAGTWPAGHTMHLVDALMSGRNSSLATNTHFRLRDGGAAGPIKFTFQHSTGATGAPEHFEFNHTWEEHPIFTTSVYLEIVTGTLSLAINLQGYSSHA